MTITQFIEKAIQGGWKHEEDAPREVLYKWKVMLDLLAWQAVGKVEGWDKKDEEKLHLYRLSGGGGDIPKGMYQYVDKMHRMVDALVGGKTIEQFLETL